jgi:NADPH:quinone reductase-like Zn-dependent oxidoreductase
VLALLTRWIGDKRVALGITTYTKEDVVFVKELIEAGRYRAVIDRTYALEDVVEATTYVETGQKTGNVVLTVSHHGTT